MIIARFRRDINPARRIYARSGGESIEAKELDRIDRINMIKKIRQVNEA
jgi:hypothetical protein